MAVTRRDYLTYLALAIAAAVIAVINVLAGGLPEGVLLLLVTAAMLPIGLIGFRPHTHR